MKCVFPVSWISRSVAPARTARYTRGREDPLIRCGNSRRVPLSSSSARCSGFNPAASCALGLKTASKHTAGDVCALAWHRISIPLVDCVYGRALELPAVRVSRGPLVIYCHPIRLLPGALSSRQLRGKAELVQEHGLGEERCG